MKDYLAKTNPAMLMNYAPSPVLMKERDHYHKDQSYSNRLFEVRIES
jgi:hypothetical protein